MEDPHPVSSSSDDDELGNYRPSQLPSYEATQATLVEELQLQEAQRTKHKVIAEAHRAELRNYTALTASLAALDRQDTARHLLQCHLYKQQRHTKAAGSSQSEEARQTEEARRRMLDEWTRWPLPPAGLSLPADALQTDLKALFAREQIRQTRLAGFTPTEDEEEVSIVQVGKVSKILDRALGDLAEHMARKYPRSRVYTNRPPLTWRDVSRTLRKMPDDLVPPEVKRAGEARCRLLFGAAKDEDGIDSDESLELSDDDTSDLTDGSDGSSELSTDTSTGTETSSSSSTTSTATRSGANRGATS